MNTLILFGIISVCSIGYVVYYMKSGKHAKFYNNHTAAKAEVEENYNSYFTKLKEDPNTFKPIINIIGSDFIALATCKKPRTILGAVADTAATAVTRIVKISNNVNTLVLTDEKLHYLEYNASAKEAINHLVFNKSDITNLKFEQGKLTDNLKQSMSVKLKKGGESGDRIDNSELMKLSFTDKDKKYEFFVYETARFGEGFKPKKEMVTTATDQSVEDVVKSFYLPKKIAEQFYEKIVQF